MTTQNSDSARDAMIERMLKDPEFLADVEHTHWHIETLTPFDGSCPQRCTTGDPREVLREYIR